MVSTLLSSSSNSSSSEKLQNQECRASWTRRPLGRLHGFELRRVLLTPKCAEVDTSCLVASDGSNELLRNHRSVCTVAGLIPTRPRPARSIRRTASKACRVRLFLVSNFNAGNAGRSSAAPLKSLESAEMHRLEFAMAFQFAQPRIGDSGTRESSVTSCSRFNSFESRVGNRYPTQTQIDKVGSSLRCERPASVI